MAYEFKKLSNVDIVETPSETANVLIEEDGVIKKAPKTAVGGAGGSDEYDMVILAGGRSTNDYIPLGYVQLGNCTIETGTYNDIFTKITKEEKMPKALFKYIGNDGNTTVYEFCEFSKFEIDSNNNISMFTKEPNATDEILHMTLRMFKLGPNGLIAMDSAPVKIDSSY